MERVMQSRCPERNEFIMDMLVAKLVEKVGISEEQAKKVAEFIKENKDQIPAWIGSAGLKDKLPGGLGGMLG